MSEAGAVICGFRDEATGMTAVAWSIGEASGGLVERAGEVSPAAASVEARGDSTVLGLEVSGGRLTATLQPLGDPARGEGVTAHRARAEIAGAESSGPLGHVTRWQEPSAGGTLRHLGVPVAEGGLLILLAMGPPDAPHGAEATRAWRIDPSGRVAEFREALLSTEYDEAGEPARVGLELWGEDPEAPATRGSGTRLGAAESGAGVSAIVLESSVEGVPGHGTYLIRRG